MNECSNELKTRSLNTWAEVENDKELWQKESRASQGEKLINTKGAELSLKEIYKPMGKDPHRSRRN